MSFIETLSLDPINVLTALPSKKASVDSVLHGRDLLTKALQVQLALVANYNTKGPASWVQNRNGRYQLSVRIQRKLIEFAPGSNWIEFKDKPSVQAALHQLIKEVANCKFDGFFKSQPEAQELALNAD